MAAHAISRPLWNAQSLANAVQVPAQAKDWCPLRWCHAQGFPACLDCVHVPWAYEATRFTEVSKYRTALSASAPTRLPRCELRRLGATNAPKGATQLLSGEGCRQRGRACTRTSEPASAPCGPAEAPSSGGEATAGAPASCSAAGLLEAHTASPSSAEACCQAPAETTWPACGLERPRACAADAAASLSSAAASAAALPASQGFIQAAGPAPPLPGLRFAAKPRPSPCSAGTPRLLRGRAPGAGPPGTGLSKDLLSGGVPAGGSGGRGARFENMLSECASGKGVGT